MSSGSHIAGVLISFGVHVIVAAAVIASNWTGCGVQSALSSGFEEAEVIEASLAYKKVEPKSRQPQKQKRKKFKPPDAQKFSRDDKKKPEKKKEEKKKPKVKPDEFDPASVLEKNRAQEEDLSSTGVEELPRDGQVDGSVWGTEREGRNHKYIGELKGRIYSVWEYPAISADEGSAQGCVKLDEKGRIVDREVKRGKNRDLNRSVQLALKNAPDMEDPVPAELTVLLTQKGICFRMTPKDL